jgi:hypothetical protein
MANKKPAWSYSALNSYETCPHRHYRTKVVKDIREPQSEQLLWGNRVHKALELRVRDGTPLPKDMQKWEPIVERLLAKKGESIPEQKLCLNEQLMATGWFDKDAWCRGIVDYMLVDGDKAVALDWKTGKPKEDHDQLMLFAALLFHTYPELETIRTGYVWLAHGCKITTKEFSRADVPSIWSEFLPRVKRLVTAHKNDKWEKKPSGLCRAWCPVLDCEFNGKS